MEEVEEINASINTIEDTLVRFTQRLQQQMQDYHHHDMNPDNKARDDESKLQTIVNKDAALACAHDSDSARTNLPLDLTPHAQEMMPKVAEQMNDVKSTWFLLLVSSSWNPAACGSLIMLVICLVIALLIRFLGAGSQDPAFY